MGINSETLKKILELAVHAPSGDNGQPWKFKIISDTLETILIKDSDNSLYNYRDSGSIFSHGALIKNIEVISPNYGFHAVPVIFPNGENDEVTSKIIFNYNSNIQTDPLSKYVKLRCTNRKFYNLTKINSACKQLLIQSFNNSSDINIHILEDLTNKKQLIEVLSYNDRLLFENKYIHDKIFQIINWTEKEEIKKGKGLFVKAMELSPEQIIAFRKFKNWNIMKLLNSLGISKLIAKQNQRLYSSSSAIGLVSIKNFSNFNYLNAGRKFQQFWLSATKLGLSIHPIAGLAYLINRVKENDKTNLSEGDLELIRLAEKQIYLSFNLKEQFLAMIFRIGYDGEPSARSSKLPPNII